MRVVTAAVPLASQPAQLYASCDVDATACLVVHKALESAAEKGAAEARGMLFDWLVLLAARSADLLGRRGKVGRGRGACARAGAAQAACWSPHAAVQAAQWCNTCAGPAPARLPQVDASLAHVEALQQLPHLVYALLRGPLLQPPGAAAPQPQPWRQPPDSAALLRSLLCQLPPDELAVAVCPQLSSWASPEEVAVLHHSLSSAALAVGQQPIWVLDAWQQLVVLYTAAAAAGSGGSEQPPPPFPPPAASLLRRTLAGVRQARRCTPALLTLWQGADDTAPFDAWLIEDAPAAAAGAAAPQQQQQQQWPTFVAFLYAAASQAQALLDRHRAMR